MILRRAALILAALAAAAPSIAPAQTAPATLAGAPSSYLNRGYEGHPAGETVRVDLSNDATETRTLSLPRGKSAVIDLPTDARDVLVSDPKVADVVLSTPRRIYVLGVGGGQTDAAFFDAAGRQLLRLNIRVDQDVSALADTLNRILPGSTIRVDAVNQNIVLSGEVPSASVADKAIRLAQGVVGKPEQVVNMLSVTESEQVMLKVRIVEVNRSIIKQLGFNLSALIGQAGSSQFLFNTAASFGVNGSLLGGLSGAGYQTDTTQTPEIQVPCASGLTGTCYQVVRPGSPTYLNGNSGTTISNPSTATTQTTVGSNGLNKGSATIEAFERVGLVRTLAEPNLTAVSGESAKFLVGGEFPVPVGEDSTGRITVDFKQYGVGLGFTPVVLSKGRISLKLSTEVSEITNTGAFSTNVSSATSTSSASVLVIPGLNVRRAETAVELPSGQSLMIAGLLQSVNKETLDSLPGLMQVPVLGALFRSRDYQQGETELVIIVTPYLVKPVPPGQLQTPADGLVMANDLETNLLGRLNKSVGATPPKDKTYQGPIGYVVE
jgi:pilus assembly protein CpaC